MIYCLLPSPNGGDIQIQFKDMLTSLQSECHPFSTYFAHGVSLSGCLVLGYVCEKPKRLTSGSSNSCKRKSKRSIIAIIMHRKKRLKQGVEVEFRINKNGYEEHSRAKEWCDKKKNMHLRKEWLIRAAIIWIHMWS